VDNDTNPSEEVDETVSAFFYIERLPDDWESANQWILDYEPERTNVD